MLKSQSKENENDCYFMANDDKKTVNEPSLTKQNYSTGLKASNHQVQHVL